MKDLILQNPYRVLGVLANAKKRDIILHANKLKKYIDADVPLLMNDFSFPILGALDRSKDAIDIALAQLNLDSDRMQAALFWFNNGDPITDEVAFEALKDNNKMLAMDIWTKRTYRKEVSECYASAWNNFSTLLLLMDDYEHAIPLKIQLLTSDCVQQAFVSTVTDKTFNISKDNLQLNFLNEFKKDIIKLSKIIINIDFSAKELFFRNIRYEFIQKIRSEIEITKKKRKGDKSVGADEAKGLYNSTAKLVEQLKSICENSVEYSVISDDIAEEILNCGIDYFNFWSKAEIFIEDFLIVHELINISDKLAVGNLIKYRIAETIKSLSQYDKKMQTQLQSQIQQLKTLEERYYEKQIQLAVSDYSDVQKAEEKMKKILKWKFFKNGSKLKTQILEQQKRIDDIRQKFNDIKKKGHDEKIEKLSALSNQITELQNQIQQAKKYITL